MRRLEAGPSGRLAPTTAPGPGASFSPDGETRGDAVAALRVQNAHPTSAVAQASVFPGARQAPNGVTGGFHEHGLMAPCIGLRVSCPSKRWAKILTPPGWPWSKPTKHRARNAEVSAESRLSTAMPRHREVPEHAGPMGPGVPRALRYEGHRRVRLRRPRVANTRGAFARPREGARSR